MRNHLVLLLALVIPACGGDDGTPVDGPPGPSPVGTWRALPFAFETPRPIDQRNRMVFGADGTLATTIDGATRTWTYTTESGSILTTATDGAEPHAERFQYYLEGDTLLEDALIPAGAGDGPIDVWTSHGQLNDEQVDVTWDLRNDQTAEITLARTSTGPHVYTGTWGGDGADLLIDVSIEGVDEQLLGRMFGGRLGVPYERVP